MSQPLKYQCLYNNANYYSFLPYSYLPQQSQPPFQQRYPVQFYPNQPQIAYLVNNNNTIAPQQVPFYYYQQGLFPSLNTPYNQINIGNTFHQVNYNVQQNETAGQTIDSMVVNQNQSVIRSDDARTEKKEIGNKEYVEKQGIFKEFPVMKERLFNQKGDVTSTVINKIDFSDEKKGKKTIAKRESIMNEDGNITLKEEEEEKDNDDDYQNEEGENDDLVNDETYKKERTTLSRKRRRGASKRKTAQSSKKNHNTRNSTNKSVSSKKPKPQPKQDPVPTNVNNNFDYHSRIQTRTSLHNAMLKDASTSNEPLEVFLYNNLDNHLSDSFFDLVNNKKHTKKYREMNYVQTHSPAEFMDINFIQKLKEKPEPRPPIVPCKDIPDFDIDSTKKNSNVIVTWNRALFAEKNPNIRVEEVIRKIEEKWPKKIIPYWDDRALQFLALCNYNIELTVRNVSDQSILFMNYANKIIKETKDNYPNM